jgi:hypothetical protein
MQAGKASIALTPWPGQIPVTIPARNAASTAKGSADVWCINARRRYRNATATPQAVRKTRKTRISRLTGPTGTPPRRMSTPLSAISSTANPALQSAQMANKAVWQIAFALPLAMRLAFVSFSALFYAASGMVLQRVGPVGSHRSCGVRPVCLARRASMRGPSSSSS